MLRTQQISTYQFSHPKDNLFANTRRKEHESSFTAAFTEKYRDRATALHCGSVKTEILLTREIPVNGFGIADLLAVSWAPLSCPPNKKFDVDELEARRPTIRAFEVKLEDWKGGLMQAHRYKYFADASILILPLRNIRRATENLDTFRKLQVGLWGFDDQRSVIRTIYTPRPRFQANPKYRRAALQRVLDSATAQHGG